ncbi:Gfo/Idh/MocA family oxidoreductase [Nocardia cyriacigeorgica]|uniref:Gfo/Idh/MocA family oxidoreductase n=1 Tax=Nocardia cyriacigeorgica TaxID=135487 RepID=A0A6P1D5E7_9NOCA|nr:Gfo/Idh/MocA family oxidoreductase [Nocardia cyriacigeorgica]NEW41024.1 Gfo/Idh/MocA family oxidoreductase [Nocardia cyriacigeorgica]NEW44290.1 Gfo/Idh/MocA family oxidoreductase [Nocardia cyriacigeorgica]NEW51171.1 Gfo/Idh/MocA family oxidoreductase [Nocardia cyriacigeorgica]NEW55242.1 Gfo/Idh/MocA family oxidoreductase [Nocardia cyriacigeorgica]
MRKKAVVVGASFPVYAEALAGPDAPVELVGVLSRGSQNADALASRLGVGSYHRIDDLPPVDMAFVVVRSGIVGGAGTEISAQLLRRGIHVLQEQPVHADEIVSLLATARANSVRYAVNDFYSAVAPVRQFIDAATALTRRTPVTYVHARAALQVAFPLFTILATVVPRLTPSTIEAAPATGGPFTPGRMTLATVPVDILMQNELCPDDPDSHARLLHEITLGTDAGELVLTHTHGSTRWHPRQHRTLVEHGDRALSDIVGTAYDPTVHDVRHVLWPDAVRTAAAAFAEAVDRPHPLVSQRFLKATRLWSEFTAALGPAASIAPVRIPPVVAGELITS